MATSNLDGSFNLRTTRGGDVPQYLLDGVPLSPVIPENTIIINKPSDLPAPVSGVITLEGTKSYRISGLVDISPNRIELVQGSLTNIVGDGTNTDGLISDTTGALITSVDGFLGCFNCFFECPNGTAFDFSASAPLNPFSVLLFNTCNIGSAVTAFKLTDVLLSSFINAGIGIIPGSITNGIQFFGAQSGQFFINTSNFPALNGKAIDFGTALLTGIKIDGNTFASTMTNVFMDGATSSANIVSGSMALLTGTNFVGNLPPTINNITESDIRWEYKDNASIANSTKTVDTFLSGSITSTISSQSTYITVGSTSWISSVSERFTTSTAGILTYISETSSEFFISGAGTYDKNGQEIRIGIAIDGVAQLKTVGIQTDTEITTIDCSGSFNLSTGNTVELFHANFSSNANLDMLSARLIIINGF